MAVDRTAELAASVAAGAVVASAAPMLSDWLAIVLFGALGAFIRVGWDPVLRTRAIDAAWTFATGLALAGVFAWFATVYAAQHADMPLDLLLGPIAATIAAVGKDWPGLLRAAWRWRTGNANGGQPQ